MIKTSLLRYAAIGKATVSMAGFAAASTVQIGTTGAASNQQVRLNNSTDVSSFNDNNVGAANFNAQGAASGSVSADKNTSLMGGVGSGAAINSYGTQTAATVTNGSMGAAMAGSMGAGAGDSVGVGLNLTGADSNNQVSVDNNRSIEMTNLNDVQVSNTNIQSAQSGNVSADKNTTVGGLTSGPATNTGSTVTTLNVSN
jgi:hypothetical protein